MSIVGAAVATVANSGANAVARMHLAAGAAQITPASCVRRARLGVFRLASLGEQGKRPLAGTPDSCVWSVGYAQLQTES